MRILLGLFLLLVAPKGEAYLSSDFDANWGVSFLNIQVDDLESRSLESFTTIEVGYNIIFASIDTALNISFMEMISSNFGSIPFTRIAVGPRWYIRGLNGTRVLLDSEVQGRSWKPSPFLGVQLGFGSLSLEDDTDDQFDNNFNAAVIDANVELGLETPITSDFILIGQFSYLLSVLSGSDDTRPGLNYGGLQIFLGFKFTQF